jgi:predicted nucleic acid-binding protein
MSARKFLDTNVLIYAATGRDESPAKHRRAEEIIARDDIGFSTQVLGEFVHNVQSKKKMSRPLSAIETMEWLERLFEFPLVEVDSAIVATAAIVQQRYQLSYWDSQIIAAAERLGADVLYSEDLNHGQSYGSVRCENPFRIQ